MHQIMGIHRIIGTIILIAYAGLSGADTYDAEFTVIAPPQCANNLGETVLFKDHQSENAAYAAGMAHRNNQGEPVVNRFNFQKAPALLQAFIDLHECAHHQTGDIDRPHPPRNSPEHLMNESIADCIAILRMRDDSRYQDMGFEDVATALSNALSNAMTAAGFPEISVTSRISNIRNCHDNYPSAPEFIAGVLADRGLPNAG